MKFAFIDYQDKSQCSECIYREPRAEPVSPFDKVSEIDLVEKVWEKIEGSFFLSNYTLTGLSVAQSSIFANFTTAISVFAGASQPSGEPGSMEELLYSGVSKV